jgi:hypothetical protein
MVDVVEVVAASVEVGFAATELSDATVLLPATDASDCGADVGEPDAHAASSDIATANATRRRFMAATVVPIGSWIFDSALSAG